MSSQEKIGYLFALRQWPSWFLGGSFLAALLLLIWVPVAPRYLLVAAAAGVLAFAVHHFLLKWKRADDYDFWALTALALAIPGILVARPWWVDCSPSQAHLREAQYFFVFVASMSAGHCLLKLFHGNERVA